MSEERKVTNVIQLEFCKPIIERLKTHRIYIDTMGSMVMIMLALFEEKYDLLDIIDDSNKEKRAGILYRQLMLRGLLEKSKDEDASHYRLTPQGIELVTFFKEQWKDQPKHVEVKAEDLVPIAKTERMDIDAWISTYVNLFPIKNAEGRNLRMHEVPVAKKMEGFIKRYKYAKEVILEATKLYLKEQNTNDPTHKYTKNSQNFIQKYGDGIESELASWCKRYLDSANEPKETGFDSRILDMA